MFNTGIFPDKLKIAKVVPIFKKGDKLNINNYRPISLLPAISKVIEKIMADQLSEFFENMKLLSNSQYYGFRSGHSTEFAALDLVDNILAQMNNKAYFSIFQKLLTHLIIKFFLIN